MTKKRRSPRGNVSSRKQKRRKQNLTSLAIPITVGLVVVVVIVGVILSAENRSSAGLPSSVNTAEGLNTESIPYPNVPRISLADTQKELERGQAILVDVRSKSSYDTGHAAGAISIPEEETNARLNELPRDKDIILYCT